MLYNFSHNYLANSIKHEWQIRPMTTLKESREQCLPHFMYTYQQKVHTEDRLISASPYNSYILSQLMPIAVSLPKPASSLEGSPMHRQCVCANIQFATITCTSHVYMYHRISFCGTNILASHLLSTGNTCNSVWYTHVHILLPVLFYWPKE